MPKTVQKILADLGPSLPPAPGGSMVLLRDGVVATVDEVAGSEVTLRCNDGTILTSGLEELVHPSTLQAALRNPKNRAAFLAEGISPQLLERYAPLEPKRSSPLTTPAAAALEVPAFLIPDFVDVSLPDGIQERRSAIKEAIRHRVPSQGGGGGKAYSHAELADGSRIRFSSIWDPNERKLILEAPIHQKGQSAQYVVTPGGKIARIGPNIVANDASIKAAHHTAIARILAVMRLLDQSPPDAQVTAWYRSC